MGTEILLTTLSLFTFLRPGGSSPVRVLADFIARAQAIADTVERQYAVEEFLRDALRGGTPLIQDSTVSFISTGPASSVRVASDLNGWNPQADTMKQLRGTDFRYFSAVVPAAARFEYKFIVDSTWVLDPLNPRRVSGGYGPNSEVWMPSYRPPADVTVRLRVPRGTLDTIRIRSAILGRTHTVTVYRPPGYAASSAAAPVLYVLDGGEYLSLGVMNVVLDNLIADRAITPPVCIFLDPRTNPADSRTSMRMGDYAMSDSFLTSLITEIRPFIMKRYRCSGNPAQTGIMGASLGGLAAVHAAFERPEVFGFCAAQSPSFWWDNARLLTRIENSPSRPFAVYIDTGTIRDAQDAARRARDLFAARGYRLHYEEHPEGHNWVNWRARIGSILRFFSGTP